MTLVNARAAFETAIKNAVTTADNTVTVVLFLLIIIIFICLTCSIFIASFTGKELDTIPTWLIK